MVHGYQFSVRSELQRQRSPGRRRYYLKSFAPGYGCASHGSASEAADGRQREGLLVKLPVGLLAAWFDNHWSSASNDVNGATGLEPTSRARAAAFTSGFGGFGFRNTTVDYHIVGKQRRGWATGALSSSLQEGSAHPEVLLLLLLLLLSLTEPRRTPASSLHCSVHPRRCRAANARLSPGL